MTLEMYAAIGVLLVAILAWIGVWALWRASRVAARRLLANAEKEARRVRARAEIDSQRVQKDGEILIRERLLALLVARKAGLTCLYHILYKNAASRELASPGSAKISRRAEK